MINGSGYDSPSPKGFTTFFYALIIVFTGWIAFNVTDTKVELGKIQVEIKRLDLNINEVKKQLERR